MKYYKMTDIEKSRNPVDGFTAFSVSMQKKFSKLFPAIESRVGCVEVLGIQALLRDAQSFAETGGLK